MNTINIRIALTVWPALMFSVLVLPLPGVPFIAAFAIFLSACVLLAKSNLDLRVGKATICVLWLVSIACLVYFFAAFGAGVDAADAGHPTPAWATMVWVAPLVSILALISATVALWISPRKQTA